MIGRYFAMDRDNRWNRVEEAYRLMTEGEATVLPVLRLMDWQQAYAADENDEFVRAPVLVKPSRYRMVTALYL